MVEILTNRIIFFIGELLMAIFIPNKIIVILKNIKDQVFQIIKIFHQNSLFIWKKISIIYLLILFHFYFLYRQFFKFFFIIIAICNFKNKFKRIIKS